MYIKHNLIKLADELYAYKSNAPKPLVVALSIAEAYLAYKLDAEIGLGNTLYWLAVLISIYGLQRPKPSKPIVSSGQAISELIDSIFCFYGDSLSKMPIKHSIFNVLVSLGLTDDAKIEKELRAVLRTKLALRQTTILTLDKTSVTIKLHNVLAELANLSK